MIIPDFRSHPVIINRVVKNDFAKSQSADDLILLVWEKPPQERTRPQTLLLAYRPFIDRPHTAPLIHEQEHFRRLPYPAERRILKHLVRNALR